MWLDSLASLSAALALYKNFGFHEIGQYIPNPVPGAIFMELDLTALQPSVPPLQLL